MSKPFYQYNKDYYSKLFYPHVSVFGKLLVDNVCCWDKRHTCKGKDGVLHHAAYKLPNVDLMVKDIEFDMLGILLYPVCNDCHKVLHSLRYWHLVKHKQSLKYSHNKIEAIERLSKNWNSLVVHYQYKRQESDKIWKAFNV